MVVRRGDCTAEFATGIVRRIAQAGTAGKGDAYDSFLAVERKLPGSPLRRQRAQIAARSAVAIVSDVGIRLVAQGGGDLQAGNMVVVAVNEFIAGIKLRLVVTIFIQKYHPAVFPAQAVARGKVDTCAALNGFTARQIQRKQKLARCINELLGLQIRTKAWHTGSQQDADDAQHDQQFGQGEAVRMCAKTVKGVMCLHVALLLHQHAAGAAAAGLPAAVFSPRLLKVSVPHTSSLKCVSTCGPPGVADNTTQCWMASPGQAAALIWYALPAAVLPEYQRKELALAAV